jgi:excisionase family DNA binding protein
MAILTVPQAATRLNLSPQRVRVLLKQGRLRGSQFGPLWQVTEAEIERFSKLTRPPHRPKSKPEKGIKKSGKSAPETR